MTLWAARPTPLGGYALRVQHWAQETCGQLGLISADGLPQLPREVMSEGTTRPKPIAVTSHLPDTILSGSARD